MSIELPGWVADAFNLIGLPWPGIDEDQLRAWARDLRAYAAEITALSGSSRSAVAALAASGDSSFGRTLAAQWEHHHRLVSDLRGPMEVFAGALDIAADAVEAQKVVVIGAAVVLAGEVIAAQGEALVTFGLAEAEVPAEVAVARLAVKAALQELEGQLLGLLINKAAAEISSLVGGTVGRLVSGGGQVAAEAVTLTADYHAMTTLSGALSGHAGRVEQASSVSWRKAGSGSLEEGGPGGGWREVARAVEQTVLQVLRQLFVDLGRALWKIITDTIAFLKKAIAALRHTDDTLAADARRAGTNAEGGLVAVGSADGIAPGGSGNYVPVSAANGSPRLFKRLFPQLTEVNAPRYAQGPEWRRNCQSCVNAVDHTLAGNAASAVPRPAKGFPWPDSVTKTIGGGKPFVRVGSYDDITDQLTKAGDGARGVVWGRRFTQVGNRTIEVEGHVFNVVNRGGRVYYVDGQTGRFARLANYGSLYFLRTN